MISEIMELPVDHPAVAQGCICVFAPLQMAIVSPDNMLNRAFPAFDLKAPIEIVVERATSFAFGGLDALARTENTRTQLGPRQRPGKRATRRIKQSR